MEARRSRRPQEPAPRTMSVSEGRNTASGTRIKKKKIVVSLLL